MRTRPVSLEAPALSVFVRTPGLGASKTRLAALWGEAKTAEFYGFCLRCAEELMRQGARAGWDPEWAVAESEGLGDARWSGFRAIWQGTGGLGTRLAQVLDASLRRRPRALILGSDAPQVALADLEAAHKALDSHDIVLGPAADGGFWLLAARDPIPKQVLEAVPYSREDTRSNLIRALRTWKPRIRISESLPLLRDADVPADTVGLADVLGEGGGQGALRKWLLGLEGMEHG